MSAPTPPIRSRLLVLLRRHPGARVSDLARAYSAWEGRPPSARLLYYHLATLSRRREVISELSEGDRRYYPPKGPWTSQPRAWAALQGETTGTVARHLASAPDTTSADVAWTMHRERGWARSRTYEALDRLRDLDLLELTRDDAGVRCRASQRLRALLALSAADVGAGATAVTTIGSTSGA